MAPAAADVVADAEHHELLVHAIRSLREPYRTTLLLRYFEGLPPRDIARQMAVPAETVRVRTRRALEMVRQHLDGTHGSRRVWIAAFLPLASSADRGIATVASASEAHSHLSSLLMSTSTKLVGSAALLASVTWFAWPSGVESQDSAELLRGTSMSDSRGRSQDRIATGTGPPPLESSAASVREAVRPNAVPTVNTVASRLHGTIVAFGGGQLIGNALEHAREDGLLTLEALDGDTPTELEVSVTDGAWSLEVEPDVRYRVVRATLGARLTRVDDVPILVASDAPVALSARWVTDVLLHVVDAELGIELDAVDVLVQESWEARWEHPTAASLQNALITGAQSPVLIEVNSGRFRVRVRARGYSWADIELDFDQGAERTIRLSRGASLVVIADVDAIDAPVQVRLYPSGWDNPDPAYVALDLVPGEPTLFESLRTGAHQVRVEFGNWRDPPTILAQREVTLVPGERKTVTLTTDADLVVPRSAALAGTLELPAGAAELPVELQIRPGLGPGWRASDKQRIPLAHMQVTGRRKDVPLGCWGCELRPGQSDRAPATS